MEPTSQRRIQLRGSGLTGQIVLVMAGNRRSEGLETQGVGLLLVHLLFVYLNALGRCRTGVPPEMVIKLG
jgi:hypothetical protein